MVSTLDFESSNPSSNLGGTFYAFRFHFYFHYPKAYGDFNLHLDDLRDIDIKKFTDLLETFSLSQHVSGPTHLSGHTLDLIITRSSDHIVLASPKTTFPISDHFIIQCPIGFSRSALSCKKLTFRKLKNIDIAAGKVSAQPHTIVKQICFPNGNVLFLSLFSLFKN